MTRRIVSCPMAAVCSDVPVPARGRSLFPAGSGQRDYPTVPPRPLRSPASARRPGAGIPRPGAIVWPQRFSDGPGAWLHLHILAPDGVLKEQLDSLDVPFQPQPPPTQPQVVALAKTQHRRVTRLLRRSKDVAADDPLLEACARQPATPIRQPTRPPTRGGRPTLLADPGGLTVHATTSVPRAIARGWND